MISTPTRRVCQCSDPTDAVGAEHHSDACNDAYVADFGHELDRAQLERRPRHLRVVAHPHPFTPRYG